MAILSIPDKDIRIQDPEEIRKFMNSRGIFFDQWHCDVVFDDSASQEDILKAVRIPADQVGRVGTKGDITSIAGNSNVRV